MTVFRHTANVIPVFDTTEEGKNAASSKMIVRLRCRMDGLRRMTVTIDDVVPFFRVDRPRAAGDPSPVFYTP